MKQNRLTRLERLARERPCPGCGRVSRPRSAPGMAYDPNRLSAEEQRELARLLRAGTTEPCVRCGCAGYDIARLTDNQKRHTLRLLRTLSGRTQPDHADRWDSNDAKRSST